MGALFTSATCKARNSQLAIPRVTARHLAVRDERAPLLRSNVAAPSGGGPKLSTGAMTALDAALCPTLKSGPMVAAYESRPTGHAHPDRHLTNPDAISNNIRMARDIKSRGLP